MMSRNFCVCILFRAWDFRSVSMARTIALWKKKANPYLIVDAHEIRFCCESGVRSEERETGDKYEKSRPVFILPFYFESVKTILAEKVGSY